MTRINITNPGMMKKDKISNPRDNLDRLIQAYNRVEKLYLKRGMIFNDNKGDVYFYRTINTNNDNNLKGGYQIEVCNQTSTSKNGVISFLPRLPFTENEFLFPFHSSEVGFEVFKYLVKNYQNYIHIEEKIGNEFFDCDTLLEKLASKYYKSEDRLVNN